MNALIPDATPESPAPRNGAPERHREERPPQKASEPSIEVVGLRGARATVAGADALFDLIRQANAALADDDPRKITGGWLARVETIRDMILDLSTLDDSELALERRQLARGWEEMVSVLRSIVESVERPPEGLDDV